MTISVFLDPTQMPAQGQPQAVFDANVGQLFANLPNFVQQVNSTTANLNSIAAGGAFAVPYRFAGNSTSNGSANGGVMAYGGGTQLLVDTIGSDGKTVAGLLSSLNTVSSAVKGHVRIIKIGDPSKWVIYSINSYSQNAGGLYGVLTVGLVDHSPSYQFADGDNIIMFLQLTGDKGDKGDQGAATTNAVMRVRDDRPAGTGGDTAVQTTWAARTFNTVAYNTISGASLSGNQITLPAGTYRFVGSAPAYQTNAHQVRLFNVTDNGTVDYGTNEYAGSNMNDVTRSFVRGQFTIGSARTFSLQHWASSAGSFGVANLAGSTQVYAELQFEKVG